MCNGIQRRLNTFELHILLPSRTEFLLWHTRLTKMLASVAVLAQMLAPLAQLQKMTAFSKSTLTHVSNAAHAKAFAPLALPNRHKLFLE